ncbi:MAG: InlB B-repeat-containing protein, partial [Eubacterium sp.]|nr:InlB B-repeat-containing protein [Eubacterium sp.]
MKISKKIVSVLLSMLMMLSVISGLNFSASAYYYDDEAVSGLFAAKYSKYQVFDVQRTPAYPGGTQESPTEFTVNNFGTPKGVMSNKITEDGWFYFKGIGSASEQGIAYNSDWNCQAEGLDPYIVELWYNNNHGYDAKCYDGVVGAIGEEGFFFEGDSHWGYYFSNNHAYEYSVNQVVTYTPVANGRVVCNRSLLNDYHESSMLIPDGYYRVTFNPGEGSGNSYSYGAKRVTFTDADAFTAPTGKAFDHWTNNINSYNIGDTLDISEEMSFTACWVDGVTVTFDTQGGSAVASQTIKPNTVVNANKTITSRDGYKFNGWQLNGADFDLSTPITEDITLTATWKASNYVLELDAEDGVYPYGWSGDSGWVFGVGDYGEDGLISPHGGEYNLKSQNGYAHLYSPVVDLSNKQSATLSFWYVNRLDGWDADNLIVRYY